MYKRQGVEHRHEALEGGARIGRVTGRDLALERRVQKIFEAVQLHVAEQIRVDDEDRRVGEGGREVAGLVLEGVAHVLVFGRHVLHEQILGGFQHRLVGGPEDIAERIVFLRGHALLQCAGARDDHLDFDAGVFLEVLDDEVIEALAARRVDCCLLYTSM